MSPCGFDLLGGANVKNLLAAAGDMMFRSLIHFEFIFVYGVNTHRGNQVWKRHVHPNVHRSTVYHSQDMEAT